MTDMKPWFEEIQPPCTNLRPKFYCPERCACGVLTQLHTREGWAAYFVDLARECERQAENHRRRSAELEASASQYRSAQFPDPAPEPS